MNDIKAVETVYNGYRFRSRLEARWAVYFDNIGLQYVYEPETYDLGELGWYLPDFYFPQIEIFGEVKPKTFTLKEYTKAYNLPKQCLIFDSPEVTCMLHHLTHTGRDEIKEVCFSSGEPCWLSVDEEYNKCYLQKEDFWMVDIMYSLHKRRLWYSFCEDVYADCITDGAVKTARGYRFGEQKREKRPLYLADAI